MSSLQHVYLDYIGFASWLIPESLKSASTLQFFSATSANITRTILDFLGDDTFTGLTTLHLVFNSLEGMLPASFSDVRVNIMLEILKSLGYLRLFVDNWNGVIFVYRD
ncbi:hypothetical protein L1987_13270 [Smallanthus sonchifolius]|uniref:Uncharacterized protein n=1 Tax=Smallanthus sonchifolius TaxID=185202 RepID=A0ACB9JGH2_9ASTR|nr:hypothetical protein L1987_13270 [Smallanthus sonchifolius]